MLKVNVIKDQGKIIACLTGCQWDAYNVIRKRLPDCIAVCPEMVAIKPMYKAVAKCHPDDSFDEDQGVKLARDRVIAKYNKDMQKVLSTFVIEVGDAVDCIEAKTERFE